MNQNTPMIPLSKSFEIKISKNNINYALAIKLMQKRVENILCKREKELVWFLNHDHIYTCGTSAKKSEILKLNITSQIFVV